MTQHALLLTRSEEDRSATQSPSPSSLSAQKDAAGEGILLTLTLDAAQVSAVVSAVQSQEAVETRTSSDTTEQFSRPNTRIKLVNPKVTSASSTRHSISFTRTSASAPFDPTAVSASATRTQTLSAEESETPIASNVFSQSSGGIKAVVTKSSSAAIDEEPSSAAITSKVFTASSGGIKAVVTKTSTSSSEETQESSSWIPSSAFVATPSSGSRDTSSTQIESPEPSSSMPNQHNTSNAASTSNASHTIVTVTTTATSRVSNTSRSGTRVANTSLVAKPVVTNSDGIPVVTVYETTKTALVTPSLSSPIPSTTGTAESKKNFFQNIDSSPTAKALTAIISVIVISLIALAIWLCMKRRSRRVKRRDSLFDFAPTATDAKSVASIYSEKTPIIASAAPFAGAGATYPYTGDQTSFGYDSRYVEAPTSTPARSPQQADQELTASTSAVRFAGIYPCIAPERRKSSVDLGLVYRMAPDQSPHEIGHDAASTKAEMHDITPSRLPTIEQPEPTTPSSQQHVWGQAHEDSPLAVPPRPARPASLSGSITKKIDEMYNAATPRSSISLLPPVNRPWMRGPRKWASMSSVGGNGPDRRPSVDRRLYQQQLPSRFSITTFATSVEASPDLGAFRPRRTAITEQHLGDSMLRTDIFSGLSNSTTVKQDANPFSDLAQVAMEHVPVETPSPMSLSEPWASTAPLNVPTSGLANEIVVEDNHSSYSPQQGSQKKSNTGSPITMSDENTSEESLETASQASAIDEEEEEKIRALIKRRQSASSGRL